MGRAGFVHLIPLVVVAVVFGGGLSLLSAASEKSQKEAVGRVLSSSSGENKGDSSGSGKSGSSNQSEEGTSSNNTSPTGGSDQTSTSSGPGSGDKVKIESRTEDTRIKIETSPDKTKIDVRTEEGRFRTEIKDDKQITKIRTEGLKIEYKRIGDRVMLSVKNKNNQEVDLEASEEAELVAVAEDELLDDGIKIASGSAEPGFVQHGRKIRTNFPLSVNPLTGELFVSTPAGEKVVAILPAVAIQNMIRAGIMTRVDGGGGPTPSPTPEGTPSASPGGSPSASPGEGTAGATSVEGAAVELTTVNDQPVYVISGVKSQNFLGLVPVDIKVKAVVSVENGNLLDTQQGFFGRLLDLFSF